MKQVTQTLRTGKIHVSEVPIPELGDKYVLVKNRVSIISAGTEKSKIDMGKKNLLEKAKARPDLVKQVLNKLQNDGILKTYQTINARLDSPSPLGYSSAGEVIAVGKLVEDIKPGDRVACAGAGYANHAEIVAIPKNLAVKLPPSVNFESAAFTTIGAIALQGVRLLDPKMGEKILVLGLGLIGQISAQLLRANGCEVIAYDLNKDLIDLAQEYGCISLKSENPRNEILNITGNRGVDGVLICAGTSSNQPIEMCGDVTREKGRVVVVGAVGLDIPREPFFLKEISVVISRSYGPGRYDNNYEEMGNDYPFAYVRFTEQRNMETVISLLEQKKLNVERLITHQFSLEEAEKAYSIIEGERKEPYLGILLVYNPIENEMENQNIPLGKLKPLNESKLNISFYGAGNYATATLIPLFEKCPEVRFMGLTTASGRTAQGIGKNYNFEFCGSGIESLLDSKTDLICICTRHNNHPIAVEQALMRDKRVYVEKPLALEIPQLKKINHAYNQSKIPFLMVGFNRRFSEMTKLVKEHFSDCSGPKIITMRINAGKIPKDHWVHNPEIGGGRIIGEACHFIDLAAFLVGKNISQVYAMGVKKQGSSALLDDNVSINLQFEDNSIANIIYTSEGPISLPKEYIEVIGNTKSATIFDFKEVVLRAGTKKIKSKKTVMQDKGQKNMIIEMLTAIKNGQDLISKDDLMLSSLATILAVESMQINQTIKCDLSLISNDI